MGAPETEGVGATEVVWGAEGEGRSQGVGCVGHHNFLLF